MKHNSLKNKLESKADFVVCVELTGGPGFSFGPIEKFLRSYKTADNLVKPDSLDFVGPSIIPKGFDFASITLPQNPSGLANIKPADVLNHLKSEDLLGSPARIITPSA